MTDTDTSTDCGGNPNPTPGNNPDKYSETDCPYCGETIKKIPTHLRKHCEVVNDD
jgi:hypothetical protein